MGGDESALREISLSLLNERVSIVYLQAASARIYLFIMIAEMQLHGD